MKSAIKNGFFALLIAISAGPLASAQTSSAPPSANAVVAKMMELDAQRQFELAGYEAVRRYVAVNKKRRAEMLLRGTCGIDGAQQVSILSADGSGSDPEHAVFKVSQEKRETP